MNLDTVQGAKKDIQDMLLETRLAVKTILGALAHPEQYPNIEVKVTASLVKELVLALDKLRMIYREMEADLELEEELSEESRLEQELDAAFLAAEPPAQLQ